MVQQHPADKNPLFVHKALNSRPAPVLIVPTVYLLGYFCPGAGPPRALSLLVGEAVLLSRPTNLNPFQCVCVCVCAGGRAGRGGVGHCPKQPCTL